MKSLLIKPVYIEQLYIFRTQKLVPMFRQDLLYKKNLQIEFDVGPQQLPPPSIRSTYHFVIYIEFEVTIPPPPNRSTYHFVIYIEFEVTIPPPFISPHTILSFI